MRSTGGRRATIVIGPLAFVAALALVASDGTGSAAQVPAEIPESARKLENPVAATPESLASGKQIYSSQCVMCHGASGDGKGDLAIRLKYEIPDFTTAAAQRARADGEWFYVLTNGHGKMVGEGDRLSETTRWELVNYVRSFGPPTGG